ncbi:soluble lamin-associated protein of 75 kDa isoform X2 [Salmo salar]|uniref:Soluble lamin-associated protein of 75 kDa isoform X1 n=1 Tax=Salmo salar TaxID=8030 RepID=A0A1S3LSV6_SALSA|nr:soluble lamin-associated protein of 75 kDa isoform X1 [Salmo salar]XP_013994069.2 soluble lamin-associated protein of 75 kDa isoform X2 [Salmo salar]
MEFPVDVLGSVRHEEEEQAAESYMTQLRYVSPDKAESFTLPSHRMICISLCNVGFVPIYGGELKHKILALFAPEDQLTAVALFLAGQWWSVEDILRTSDPSRTGLLKVRSLGERIVLYILNRIVYRVGEMDKPEVPFLCHGQNHFAKLLWKDGHAVGFYSVKPKDSLCNGFVTQRYQLPVMDSIFVRKCHRGNGHGLQMLEDFVDSFKDDQLGLKYPLSLTMYKVCGQYLCRYPADQDLLWVVEGMGGPYQRERVANKIKALKVVLPVVTANGDHQAASLDSTDVNMEEGSDNCLDITEDVLVLNKPLKFIEALAGTPVSTHTWSSGHKKRGREEMEDSEEESQPLKMNRLEEAEPTTTAVEGEEEEGSGGGETESGEADAALSPIEEATAQEAEVKGDLTDDQGEEEEVATQEPDTVLENRTTEEDVEMEEEDTKEEDSIEAKDTVDAAPVASEELAETVAVVKEAPLLLEEAASATEKAPSPAEPAPAEPSLSVEVIEEAGGEPPEEAAATPMEEEGVEGEKEGEEKSMEAAITVDSSSQEVVQVAVADLSYQLPEEGENQPLTEEEEEEEAREEVKEDKKKELEEMENVTTTEDEKEEGESESSDEGGDGKVLWRRGSGQAAAPKHKSKRLSRVVMEPEEQGTEQPEVTEEEEEEKARTTEEEEGAVEKSLAEEEVEEEEHPPVIDQRALRRKSRQVQAPKKAKGKRRSKI